MALSNIGLAEPSTVTARIASVTHDRGSTTEHQEILVLGGQSSSLAIAQVLAATPASTEFGLVVREAAPTTIVAVSSLAGAVIVRSSAADALGTVYQSTYTALNGLMRLADRDASTNVAAVLNATPASTAYALAIREVAPTTTVQVSSVAGAVIARSSAASFLASVYQSTAADLNVTVAGYSTITTVSTGSVRVHQSTAADLNVTVAGYSTIVSVSTGSVRVHQSTAADLQLTARVNTSSGGGVEGSTTAPAVGVIGLHVRQVFPTLLSTTTLITSTHSTAVYALVSSAAGLRHKVYAYFVGSTHTNPSTAIFMSSLAIDRWHVNFGSGSSGITAANLALTPPGFLFATDSQNALNVRIEGGSSVTSTVLARFSIGYFTEA